MIIKELLQGYSQKVINLHLYFIFIFVLFIGPVFNFTLGNFTAKGRTSG